VQILDNEIVDSVHGLRIKTRVDATQSSVSNIEYSGNNASNITKFGFILDQGYPQTLGTPGNGVAITVS
jgi:polygalacturonase